MTYFYTTNTTTAYDSLDVLPKRTDIGKKRQEFDIACMHDLAKEGEPMCVSCPCPKCSARC